MHRCLPALLLLIFTLPARAQTPAQTLPAPTLAAAVQTQAMPEPGAILLTVGAEKVTLPKGTTAPITGDSAENVAASFGQTAQWCGRVLAIVPKDMTVVNVPPDTPNPYDGMAPGQVMTLLTGTFTPAQWKAFLSPAGVGYGALQSDAQRSLFGALFPQGHLIAQKDNPVGDNDTHAKQDVSGDALLQAHLRVTYFTSVALPVPGKPGTHSFTATFRTAGAPPLYYMTNAQGYGADHEFGATVKATVPNAPKDGALRFDGAALRVPVPVNNLHTVDELVARIGTAAHLELYADPRYGDKNVTIAGAAKTARASELLQALALCVRGTYRKVGPAFVLTDDTVGLATKRALWGAFEAKAKSLLPADGRYWGREGKSAPFTLKDVSFGDDPLAFTPAQQARYWAEWRKKPFGGGGGMMQLRDVPFAELSAPQQESAQRSQAYNEKHHFSTTLDGPIMLQAEPEVEVVLPALDGPVLLFGGYDDLLPHPALTPAEQKAQEKRMAAEMPDFDISPADTAPPVSLPAVMKTFTRRAVRVAPTTAAEARRAVQSARRAGFNEVWLQILPGQLSQTNAVSLLAAAAKEGRAAGIAVRPDVFLLRWQNAPPALVDRDVRGLTMTEAAVLNPRRLWNERDTVCPFAPDVQARLAGFLSALAAVPNLGGQAWDEWTPSGYANESFADDGFDGNVSLGYALPGRLAFLRSTHADPVDVYDSGYESIRADLKIPGFNDGYHSQPMQSLYGKWRTFRADAATSLVRALAQAVRGPLFLPPATSVTVTLYGSWDDLRRPLASAVSYHALWVFAGFLGTDTDKRDAEWARQARPRPAKRGKARRQKHSGGRFRAARLSGRAGAVKYTG